MESSALETAATLAMVAIGLLAGLTVHERSAAQQRIHGGALSALLNYLSASCFAAILPTVLIIVIILRPENVAFAGLEWHPLILAVLALGLGSYVLALMHAAVESGPMRLAMEAEAAREARGWTEEDAKSSGL